jgi:hypothetical protein
MPLNRFRNYQALMNLVPGTMPMSFGNAETDTPARSLATNVNGQANTNNSTRTDGATNMNIWLPNHNMIVSPADTIDTVSVSTSSFDANRAWRRRGRHRRHKSGTNKLKGSLFEFYNSDGLNANARYFGNGTVPDKLPLTAHSYGGTARRPDREEQAVLLRRLRGLQARGQPVHVLLGAERGDAARRFQPGAEHERLAAADLRSRARATRTAPTVRSSRATSSREPDRPDRAPGHERPVPATEHHGHRRGAA